MSVVTSLLSWSGNRFIVCSQLINVLSRISSSWESLLSADGTTNSSEELRGQLTLLNKLINHLKHAKQYYETGSSQEVQRKLLEFLSDTDTTPSTKQTQGTMKIFRPNLNCSPGPTPSTKSGDGVDDQRRDEPSCNSSSSTVDEDDVGSTESSYRPSSMSTSTTPHGTDQSGNCILSQEGEESVSPSWPGSGPDTDMNSPSDRSEASDDTSNLHGGHSPDFSFCQPQDSPPLFCMEGYLFFDIEKMSFLEVLRSIHTEAPLCLDRYPQTPNIACPLQAKITLSRRRTAYKYWKAAGNLLGMMMEIQMVVSELQSICVDGLRTQPESQGQSGAKLSILQQIKEDQHMLLPILQQIEATLSKEEYKFETIFYGIGLRVYILKTYFEKLYSKSEGHSVEFDDIMDFVIDAMMRADNCPNSENSVTMNDDLIKTIYAEYQLLSKHDKLLYQFVGFVLIQFVFSDSVAVDAVAQPTSPLPLAPTKQPMGWRPSLTTVAAGAGIGGQPASRLNHSVSASAPLDLNQGVLASSGGAFAGNQVQQQLLPPTTQGHYAASHAGFGDDAVAHHNLLPFLAPRKQSMVSRQPQPSALTTEAAGAGIGGQPAPRLDHSVSASAPLDLNQGGLASSVGGVSGGNNLCTQAPPLPIAGNQVQQQLLPPTTQGQHAASHAAAAYPVQQQQVLAAQQLAPQLACESMVSRQPQPSLTTEAAGAGIGRQRPAPRLNHSVSASAPLDLNQGVLASSVGGVSGGNNLCTQAPPLPIAGNQVSIADWQMVSTFLFQAAVDGDGYTNGAVQPPPQTMMVPQDQGIQQGYAVPHHSYGTSAAAATPSYFATTASIASPSPTTGQPMVPHQPQGIGEYNPQLNYSASAPPDLQQEVGLNNSVGDATTMATSTTMCPQLNGLPALLQQQQQGFDRQASQGGTASDEPAVCMQW